jgi:hypothetical protein
MHQSLGDCLCLVEKSLFPPPVLQYRGRLNHVIANGASKVGGRLTAEYINDTMKASAEYISVGANRSSSCAVCSAKGQVAFGAGRYVALWDSEVCLQLLHLVTR